MPQRASSLEKFEDWVNGNAWLVLAGLVAAAGVVVFWEFLLGRQTFLYKDIGSDTVNIFYPKLLHVADYLRSDGLPR